MIPQANPVALAIVRRRQAFEARLRRTAAARVSGRSADVVEIPRVAAPPPVRAKAVLRTEEYGPPVPLSMRLEGLSAVEQVLLATAVVAGLSTQSFRKGVGERPVEARGIACWILRSRLRLRWSDICDAFPIAPSTGWEGARRTKAVLAAGGEVSDRIRAIISDVETAVFSDPSAWMPPAENTVPSATPACRLRIAEVIAEVCDYYNIPPEVLVGESRSDDVVRPRQVAISIAHELTGQSFPAIGALFNRHHSTVMHSRKRIELLAARDADFASELAELHRRLVRLA